MTRESMLPSVLQSSYDRIKAANSVLIIGGGPTGVETAAEILAEFPGML